MSSSHWRPVALGTLFGLTQCVPPPVVPTRPSEQLARVELQINNTAEQSDDYIIGSTPTPGRVRLLNRSDVPTPVQVTLKNIDFQPHPSLMFSASGTPAAATLDLGLPGDGSWVPFVVAGGAGQLSQRDKDAVIEILERRADGIVLGRKSLMVVASAAPVSAGAPSVQIQLGDLETIDDYVTWRPVRVYVRLATASSADVPVMVRNMAPLAGGGLVFGPTPAIAANVQPPAMNSTLNITLPANGNSVDFYVAGNFGQPSTNDKDAVVEIVRASDGQLLGREGIMVRVRKNANSLTTDERDRYINAVARLNLNLGNYVVHQLIHSVVSTQGHHRPAFLAWHRAFILRYERELQAIDPRVALHYWRFDQPAPSLFSGAYMGGPPDLNGYATFTATNPLTGWVIQSLAGVFRSPQFTPSQSPTTLGINTETATLALGGSGATASYASFRTMESPNPHDWIHGFTGGIGWLGSPPTAVRDPLFFMLHANVDRLWAKWQWTYVREDPASALSYDPQGAYASGGTWALGQYAEDRMWPWDGTTGFVTPGDPGTQRPATAPGGPIPAAVGGWGPPPVPQPKNVIFWDQWTLLGAAGLGFGYDDVPFPF